jgi:hypothetical protein
MRVMKATLAIALAFISCAAIGMAINPQAWSKFFEVPAALPVFTGRSRSYYWDIALYGELALKQTCSAFYPLWSWLIRGLWQPSTLIQAGRGFLVTATGLFFGSLPLVVWVFQKGLGRRDLGFGMALLYALSPMAIFRVNGYSEGLFGVLSLLWMGVLLPMQRLPQAGVPSARMGRVRWWALGILTGLMALARPVLVQTVAAAIATLVTLLVLAYCQSPPASAKAWGQFWRHCQTTYRQPFQATVWLGFTAGLGYSVYGGWCWISRGSFFAPFQDQALWKKALGVHPELLLFPKSPLIDLWALYLPGLLLVLGLIVTYRQVTGKNLAALVPRSPLWLLLCVYPPALILGYCGQVLRLKLSGDRDPASPSQGRIDQESGFCKEPSSESLSENSLSENYLFWFSVYFAFSHSAIAFFTQDRLVSLGRYVFALPFIFLALGYILRSLPPRIANPMVYGLAGISALYLINQWVDYGFHKWLG